MYCGETKFEINNQFKLFWHTLFIGQTNQFFQILLNTSYIKTDRQFSILQATPNKMFLSYRITLKAAFKSVHARELACMTNISDMSKPFLVRWLSIQQLMQGAKLVMRTSLAWLASLGASQSSTVLYLQYSTSIVVKNRLLYLSTTVHSSCI